MYFILFEINANENVPCDVLFFVFFEVAKQPKNTKNKMTSSTMLCTFSLLSSFILISLLSNNLFALC